MSMDDEPTEGGATLDDIAETAEYLVALAESFDAIPGHAVDRIHLGGIVEALNDLKPQLYDLYDATCIMRNMLDIDQPGGEPLRPEHILKHRVRLLGFPVDRGCSVDRCFRRAGLGVEHCSEHSSEEELERTRANQDLVINGAPPEDPGE